MDPFVGTGTTMLACSSLGLRGYYSELSEAQCGYAVNRLRGIGHGMVGLLDD